VTAKNHTVVYSVTETVKCNIVGYSAILTAKCGVKRDRDSEM